MCTAVWEQQSMSKSYNKIPTQIIRCNLQAECSEKPSHATWHMLVKQGEHLVHSITVNVTFTSCTYRICKRTMKEQMRATLTIWRTVSLLAAFSRASIVRMYAVYDMRASNASSAWQSNNTNTLCFTQQAMLNSVTRAAGFFPTVRTDQQQICMFWIFY